MVAKKTAEEQSEAAAEKTAAKKTTAKKTAAKKTAAKKTAAKKTAAKKTAAKKTAAKKTTAGGTTSAAKKAAAKKSTAKKSTAKKSTAKKVGAARAAEQTGATTVVAKKTPGTATAAKTAVPKARGAAADPGDLAVRPGEEPWTPEEVEEARGGLQSEADRLRTEIDSAERSLQGMMRDSGDGAGDDEADTGSKNITREHELALAATAREVLTQTEHALERLDAGTYGLCENCGNPIGKARMQAFPRATLCVECKQKQERRY
ncbi:TraR/DksA family transcriptional regulator [Strepomyces sp. STD 3.1]|uniref:TraR/DksA family transcriptional regulator n=1 Tax=Streptomyces sp. NPDC058985 TaxID=3346684 RepID=UPI001F23CA9A|nr:TraR/DksA family transcriptional regulator [Streptomyces sp. STD 3.1]